MSIHVQYPYRTADGGVTGKPKAVKALGDCENG